MRISPTTRSNMSKMISNVRLNSNVSNVSPVKEMNKLESSTQNSNFSSNELNKEIFYDIIERNSKEKTLLEKNKDDSKNKTSVYDISEADMQTLNFMKNMLFRFNKSLDNIKKIDLIKNTHEFYNVKKCIDEHSRFLNSLGIKINQLTQFSLNEELFVNEIMHNPNNIKVLLDPTNGIIRKICDSFGKMLLY